MKNDLLKVVKKQTARSGNLLVSIGVILLLVVLGISVFLVLRQTGFINRAGSNDLAERALSAQLLETNVKNQTLEILKSPVANKSGKTTEKSPDLSFTRKKSMLALIEKDPRAFLRIALPKNIRDNLAQGVKGNVEEQVEVRGNIDVYIADNFEKKQSKESYAIRTPDGKLYEVFFPGDVSGKFGTGSSLKIKGYKLDNYLVANSISSPDLVVEFDKTLEGPAEQRIKKVVVIPVNFTTDPKKPFTKEQAYAWTFTDPNSAAAYYRETTYGMYQLSGEVTDWVTIDPGPVVCDYSGWTNKVTSILLERGFKPGDWTNQMFVLPDTNCPWGGLGTIGGGLSWINGDYAFHSEYEGNHYMENKIPIHELGHNFGAHHANGFYCINESGSPVAISEDCRSEEYSDPYDVMGTLARQMNSYHRGQLGAIDAKDTQVVKSSGNYTLRKLGKDRKSKEVIRIPRVYDATTGKVTESYYLEYRTNNGLFDRFDPNSPILQGIGIRIAPNYNAPHSTQTRLIDTHPDSNSNYDDAPLRKGETFEDRPNGIKITLTSLTSNEAQVAIQLTPQQCVRQKADLYMYPVAQWSNSNGTVTYTLTITNRDSSSCGSSAFNIVPTLFSGWKQTINPAAPINILPGQQAQVYITLQNYFNSPAGFYTFTETVNHRSSAKYQTSINSNLNIYSFDVEPPQTTMIYPTPGDVFNEGFFAQVEAKDNVTVNRVSFYVDESYVGEDTDASPYFSNYIEVNSLSNGKHALKARAIDHAGNYGDAVIDFTVQR